MTKFLLGGAALAALIAIAPATAQSGQTPPVAQAPHAQPGAAMAGPSRAQLGVHVAAMFQKLDANRDGAVTREEAQAGKGYRGARQGGRMDRQANRWPEQRAETRAAMFDRLDANRDGSISRAEFTAAPALRDRRLNARAGGDAKAGMGMARMGRMGGMRGMGLGGHMFDMADANRDGRVTMAEATAAAYRHFDMADANRDGQITREERMQMRQRMRGMRTERQPG